MAGGSADTTVETTAFGTPVMFAPSDGARDGFVFD